MTAHRRRFRLVGISVAAIALAVAVRWTVAPWTAGRTAVAPRVDWRLGDREIEPFAEVEVLQPLACELELDAPAWVYAVSFDMTRGSIALFPSTQLRSDLSANPMAAGTHRMPGRHLEHDLVWHTGDASGLISFLLVVADRAQPELDAALARMQQMGNGAFPHRPMLGTYAPAGRMDSVPERNEPPTDLLREVSALQRFGHDGEMHRLRDGVHVTCLRLRVRGSDPSNSLDARIREQLERELGPVLGSPSAPR